MTEAELLGGVMDLCKLLGFYVHHCRPAKTEKGWRTPIQGDAGFVDLVICGRNDVLFRELKSDTGKPSLEQADWITRLVEAGADVTIWRPRDMRAGLIEAELKRMR